MPGAARSTCAGRTKSIDSLASDVHVQVRPFMLPGTATLQRPFPIMVELTPGASHAGRRFFILIAGLAAGYVPGHTVREPRSCRVAGRPAYAERRRRYELARSRQGFCTRSRGYHPIA